MNFNNDNEVLDFFNRLLELLHQADLQNFGSHIQLVYVASGAQHVDHIQTQYFGETHSAALLPMARWRCGGRRSGRATWMSTTSLCSRGRRRHCWLTIWQRSWKSKINGRPSRCYGIEETCTAIITMP